MKDEIKKEIEVQLFLIQDAAEKAYELLETHGEKVLPFEVWFNLKYECNVVKHKFSKITNTFEQNDINILKQRNPNEKKNR